MVSALLCLSILVSKIDPLLTPVFLLITGSSLVAQRRLTNRLTRTIFPFFRKIFDRRVRVGLQIRIETFNGHLLYFAGSEVSLVCRILGPNIILMKLNAQEAVYKSIQTALDKTDFDLDFYFLVSGTDDNNSGDHSGGYQSYLRLQSGIESNRDKSDLVELLSKFSSFKDQLEVAGMSVSELRNRDEILEFVERVGP